MRRFLTVLVVLLMVGAWAGMVVSVFPSKFGSTLEKAPPAFSTTLTGEHERVETMQLEYAGFLSVSNQLGQVYIEGADTDQITLRVVKKAKTGLRSAAYLLDQITVETAVSAGRTQVVGRVPRTRDNEQVSLDLFLTVPRELIADLKVNLGTVEVKNVSGTLRIDDDLGSIRIYDFQGNAFIQADLGSVEIHNAEFADNLQVAASMGDVEIRGRLARSSVIENRLGAVKLFLPKGEAYELEAGVDLGSLEILVPFDGDRTTDKATGILGEGDIRGTLSLMVSLGSLRIDYQ